MTTEPAIYRKKPVEIQAMRWNGTNEAATPIINWVIAGGSTATYHCSDPDRCVETGGDCPHWIAIRTLEGTMRAELGDYVIRGVQGEFYPCKPDIFAATYDAVPADAPSRPVAAVPAPVQGADPTGPQTDADGDEEPSDTWLYDAVFNRTDGDDDPEIQRRAAYELGRAAERERAAKAEAERDKIQAQHDAFVFRASNALAAEREAHKHTPAARGGVRGARRGSDEQLR